MRLPRWVGVGVVTALLLGGLSVASAATGDEGRHDTLFQQQGSTAYDVTH